MQENINDCFLLESKIQKKNLFPFHKYTLRKIRQTSWKWYFCIISRCILFLKLFYKMSRGTSWREGDLAYHRWTVRCWNIRCLFLLGFIYVASTKEMKIIVFHRVIGFFRWKEPWEVPNLLSISEGCQLFMQAGWLWALASWVLKTFTGGDAVAIHLATCDAELSSEWIKKHFLSIHSFGIWNWFIFYSEVICVMFVSGCLHTVT